MESTKANIEIKSQELESPKLAFCIFKYFPYGGIQRDFLKIARQSLKLGSQIRVYTLAWVGDVPCNFDLVLVPVYAITRHTLYRRYSEWVRNDLAKNPVDAVVGINKIPELDIYYAGDSCFEEIAQNQRGKFYRLLPRYRHFSKYEKAVFGRESKTEILMISEYQKIFFEKYYKTSSERMHFLPPGISEDKFPPNNVELLRLNFRKELNIRPEEKLLLFVGSGFKKKGLARALKAFRSLNRDIRRETKFLVVGQDKPIYFRILSFFLFISKRVSFLGGKTNVSDFLFAADLLILPALDENTGTVILEAIVSGTPVLTTENCGYSNYVVESGMGHVVSLPFKQNALNRSLEMLLENIDKEDWLEKSKGFLNQIDITSLHRKAANIIHGFAVKKLARNVTKSESFGADHE